jgi:hypothetical protein
VSIGRMREGRYVPTQERAGTPITIRCHYNSIQIILLLLPSPIMTTTTQAAHTACRRHRRTEMVVINSASAAASQYSKRLVTSGGRTAGASHRHQVCALVHDVYLGLGPIYFRRAYRMEYSSFLHLRKKLKDNMDAAKQNMTTHISNGEKGWSL